MDNQRLYRFMDELRQQCRFTQLAFQQLKASLNGLDPEKVFFFVHAFLAHTGLVSRLLWPEREDSRPRGEQLRRELEVSEDSPLRLRGLAAQLEAEDERFEDWLETLDQAGYVDINVMPTAAIRDFKPDSFQRSLDPDTFKLHLRGVACDLKPVLEALKGLDTRIQLWQKTHHPW